MTIQTVTFAQLALSPLNVRKVKPSQIESLAEDIAAHGIIQSLGTYEEEGKYQVFAGGRRLRALQHLHGAGAIGDDYAVPVTVRSKAEAIELSTAENMSREAMHPADQVRAFAAMREEGHTASEIAARFGYSEGHVARLLKLGSLSPSLLQALAKDELSLDAAKALCLTDDHKAQREAFKACGNNAHALRRYFSAEKMATSDRLFVFVGIDAYREAGGTITADLFAEEGSGYADDAGLVEVLATQKLEQMAEALREEGWFKIRVELETPTDYYSLRPMYPQTREASEEERAAIAAAQDAITALEDSEEGDEEVGEDELESARERLWQLEEGLRSFTDNQRQIGGVIVSVDYNGEACLKHYHAISPKQAGQDEGEGADTTSAAYSGKLIEDMQGLRTLAFQQLVAGDGNLALDILLDTLAASLLHGCWAGEYGVDIRPETARIDVPDELHDERLFPIGEQVAERFASLPSSSRFEAIRALEQGEKMELLAGLVAMTLTSAGYNNPYVEAAGLDMAAVWSVNVPFCDRLTKSQALAIMAEECGADAADNCKSMKKADLATQLAERLPDGWLPEPMRGPSLPAQDEEEAMRDAA